MKLRLETWFSCLQLLSGESIDISIPSLPQKILPSRVHFIQSGSHFLTLPGICPKVRLRPKKYWGFFWSDFKMPFDFVLLPGCLLEYSDILKKKKDLPSGLSLSLELPFCLLCTCSVYLSCFTSFVLQRSSAFLLLYIPLRQSVFPETF